MNNGWVLTAKGRGPTAKGSKASHSALCFQSKVGVGAAQPKASIRSKGPRWLRPAPSVVFRAQLLPVSSSFALFYNENGSAGFERCPREKGSSERIRSTSRKSGEMAQLFRKYIHTASAGSGG